MAEVDEELGSRARQLLSEFQNVDVTVGDGGLHGPGACDAILVNAGVTHPMHLWLSRLNDGGRLLLPLTFQFPNSNLGKGALLKITRERATFGATFVSSAAPVIIFSCSSVRDAVVNEQLLKAYSTQIQRIGEVQSLRLDRHDADPTCWVHADVMCLSTNPKSSSA
jgi:protein-L-isoaspartate(D-aspartate) O-methyltransferase